MEYIEIYKGYKLTPGVLYHFSQPDRGWDNVGERLVLFKGYSIPYSKIFMINNPKYGEKYLDFATHKPDPYLEEWVIRSATEEERLWFDAWQKARKWVENPFGRVDKLDIF